MGEDKIIKLEQIEALLFAEPGTLTQNDELRNLSGWDSLAMVEFQALAQETTGVILNPMSISKSNTVGDLLALVPQIG